jgi:hypothetical protein
MRPFWHFVLMTGLLLGVLGDVTAEAHEGSQQAPCSVPRAIKVSRPDANGPPLRVAIGVLLLDIRDIRESEENFDADLILRLRWLDPRLSAETLGHSLENCDIEPSELWRPQIEIINRLSVRAGWQRLEVDASGHVAFERRFSGTIEAPFELADFPHDSQELVIRLASLAYGPDDVILEIDSARTGRIPKAKHEGWRLIDNTSEIQPALSVAGGTSHARIFHTVKVQRLQNYWFWMLVVPLSLIVLMSWSVFWLDPQAFSPQITVGSSAVFTLIAFRLSLGEKLPQIPYLTQADKLVLAATLLVFVALGQAVLTSRLAQRDQLKLARRIDFHGRWIYLALYLGALVAFL